MSLSRSKADLQKQNLENLKNICKDLNISTTGRKAVLIRRIMEAQDRSCATEGAEQSVLFDNDRNEGLAQVLVGLLRQQQEDRRLFLQIAENLASTNRITNVAAEPRTPSKQSGSLPAGIIPPEYFGDIKKFPTWWESFDAIVHSNDLVSPFYKYLYLRQCLKGPAASCLDSFSPLVEHYPTALEHVKSRYGQPRKIVRQIVKTIVEMPQISSNDSQSLRQSHDLIQGNIHALSSFLKDVDNPVDTVLIPILETKLTPELRESWEREILRNEDNKNLSIQSYLKWLNNEVRSKETTNPIQSNELNTTKERKSDSTKRNNYSYSTQSLTASSKLTKKERCKRCWKTNHRLIDCYKFLDDTVKQRWNLAKECNLCFQCLDDFHPGKTCKSKGICNAENCTRNHHPLLHFTNSDGSMDVTHSLNSKVKPLNSKGRHLDSVMPSAVAYLRVGNDVSYPVRIGFDTMCQDSFIRESVVRRLGIRYDKNITMQVNGFGERVSTMNTGRISFGLSKYPNGGTVYPVHALVRPGRICSPLDEVTIDWNRCTHLQGLDIAEKFPRPESEIDILIGVNHYLKLVTGSVVKHPTDDGVPSAIETVFGYVVMGMNEKDSRLYLHSHEREKVDCMFIQTRQKTDLEMAVENFWKLESLRNIDDKRTTSSDRESISHSENSVQFHEGRYCDSLPFRHDSRAIQNNYQKAKSIMVSAERRIQKNRESNENYEKVMSDHKKFGFAKKAAKWKWRLCPTGTL